MLAHNDVYGTVELTGRLVEIKGSVFMETTLIQGGKRQYVSPLFTSSADEDARRLIAACVAARALTSLK